MLMTERVCHKCFTDEGIKQYIKEHSQGVGCDYCNSNVKSHEIAEVIDYIHNCLLSEYEHPAECMGWNGKEGGYIGATTYDSYEILEEVGFETNSDELFESIASNLPTDHWCQRDPYQLRDREEATYTWANFTDLIKYKCRYMFLLHESMEKEKSLDRVLISSILDHILESFKCAELIRKLPKGTILYRARYYDQDKKFELKIEELAVPPTGITKSSRMSPAGIPMFYASDDISTSLREIKVQKGDNVAIADFVLESELQIIDLTAIPSMPSIFCEKSSHLRDQIYFLNQFLKDFIKPIEKDGREHIDYVPTQVVAEFCKYNLKINGQNIKGFKFPSSVSDRGISYCLFLSREDFGLYEREYYADKPDQIVFCNKIYLKYL